MIKIVFSLFILFATFLSASEKSTNTKLSTTITLLSSLSEIIHSLQKERGASCAYISSNGLTFSNELKLIKTKSDEKIDNLSIFLDENSKFLDNYYTVDEQRLLNIRFEKLIQIRNKIQNNNLTFSKTYSVYTQTITFILLQISNISDKIVNKELSDKIYLYSTLLLYKESMGQKRAALSSLFSKDKFSKEIFEYFLTSQTTEKIYLKSFFRNVDEKIKNYYLTKMDMGIIENVANFEKLAYDKLSGKKIDVNPNEWFVNITKKIDLVQEVEYEILQSIILEVHKINTNSLITLTKKEKEWLESNYLIKVAVMNYWKHDENGDNIHIDLLKLINKYGNTNFIPVRYDAWNDGYQEAIEGKNIHAIMKLSWSQEREDKYFDYTTPYNYIAIHLITRSDDMTISSIEDLKNKTIMLKSNAITNQMVNKTLKNKTIINVKYDDLMYQKLAENDNIDAFILSELNKRKLAKYNLKIAKTIYDRSGEVSIGVNKTHNELASIINKILKIIPKKEMNLLRNKKYLKAESNMAKLNNEEKKWIKTNTIRIGVEDWSPIIFLNHKKDIDGISGDYTKRIIENTGLKVEFVAKQWNDLYEDFQNDKIDLLPSSYYTKERTKDGIFSDSYLKIKDSIFVKQNNTNINSMKDLNGKTIAMIKGYGIVNSVTKNFPNIKIKLANTVDDSISWVLNGKVDALIGGQIVVSKKLDEEMISGLKSISQTSLSASGLHYITNINKPILSSIVQKGLDSISFIEKNKINLKWVKIQKEKDIQNDIKISIDGLLSTEEIIFILTIFSIILYILLKQYTKSNILSINLKTFNIVIIVFELAVILFMVFEIIILDRSENTLVTAQKDKLLMIKASDQLRQSSDDLTHFARTYAVTNNVKFKKQYEDILSIRNGEMKRPSSYNGIYWDLDKSNRELNHPLGEKKSLKDIINELSFSKHELNKLLESEENSNELSSLEVKAFDYIKQGNNNLAIQILHSDDYYKAKQSIMLPIDEMMTILETRTNNEIISIESKIKNHFMYILIVGLFFIIGNIFIYILLRKKINNPVNYLTKVMKEFQDGKTNVVRKTFYDDEIGKMNEEFFKMNNLINSKTNELEDEKNYIDTIINSQENFVITSDDTSIITANKSFYKFYNVKSVDEFIRKYGKCISDTFTKNAQSEYIQQIMNDERWLEYINNRPNEIHKVMITHHSKDYIFSVTSEKLISKGKEFKTAIFTDITQIENVKNDIEQILSNILLPVLISSKKSKKIIYANEFAQVQYGFAMDEIIGSDIDDVFVLVNENNDISNELINKGYVENFVEDLKTKNNKTFTALVSITSILYQEEEAYIGMVTDITKQKEMENQVRKIHKHTRDSIEYASLIQGALIPDIALFDNYFKDTFVMWQPKDIVGGDIYLFEELRDQNECLLMCIDCTGHGVPGAFVTMLVKAIERQIIAKIEHDKFFDIDISPAWILSYFNKKMKQLLKQDNDNSLSNAGFDGGIIYYNKKERILKFSGAETPLFYFDENGEFKTIKGSRHSVGYKKCDVNFKYDEHIIDVKDGMKFYITTDGYLDQNGGEKDFPFGKKRFTSILKDDSSISMKKLQDKLISKMDEYENMIEDNDRNDDITVIGFEIKENNAMSILEHDGELTQSIITNNIEILEGKIQNPNMLNKVSTVTIELSQNMMNYSKSIDVNCFIVKPEGYIKITKDEGYNYTIAAKNIVSTTDKEKIEPKLLEIIDMDKESLKKRYRELRKSGVNTHEKGAGIGIYEIAKLAKEVSYKFDKINDDKYYFYFNVIVEPRLKK